MKNFFCSTRQLWIGLATGVGITLICFFMFGWWRESAWLGWSELTREKQWEYFLKILGSVGALAAFLWTVSQWFLSKKLEFEISILNAIAKRHRVWSLKKRDLKKKVGDAKATEQVKQIELVLAAIEKDQRLIKKLSLGFGRLRTMNKRYLGSVLMDEDAEIHMDQVLESSFRELDIVLEDFLENLE